MYAGTRGGGGAAAAAGRYARRRAGAPAPSLGGGGEDPVGPGVAVLPHGGSQGPQHGHGRASEEGT